MLILQHYVAKFGLLDQKPPRGAVWAMFFEIINIWSRLLKHNWWNFFVWKNTCPIKRFFDFIFNENSFCTAISIVRRSNFSSCMCIISNYDFYFIVLNRLISFVNWNKSYRNHQTKISEYDWRYKDFWMLMQHVINSCWDLLVSECISNMLFRFRNMLIIIDFEENSDLYEI